jgi:hypothetical protein
MTPRESKEAPWHLAASGIVLEGEADGAAELLWINPALPPAHERASRPLRVEILCWFEDLVALNAGLRIVGDFFRRDSVLAAISRRDAATRLLLYTATWESVVQERYLAVRSILRPTAIALRAEWEPAWPSLASVVSATARRSTQATHAELADCGAVFESGRPRGQSS